MSPVYIRVAEMAAWPILSHLTNRSNFLSYSITAGFSHDSKTNAPRSGGKASARHNRHNGFMPIVKGNDQTTATCWFRISLCD